jgi:recombination protein RecA
MTGVDEAQHAIIVGSLLGDGAMRCKRNALLEINHCLGQKAYVDWKYSALAPLVATAPKARKSNSGRMAYRFVTRSLPVLTPYYMLFYGAGCKSVPEIGLSPLSLAVWFMDDGCKSRSSAYLNTQQFDLASQHRMLGILRRDFGICATLNRDKAYYRIRIAVESIGRFRAAVTPHLLPEMAYKLP